MKKRVRHVVTEIERVRSFVRAFAQGDIKAAGRLFNASHDSLAADYEVTVPRAGHRRGRGPQERRPTVRV